MVDLDKVMKLFDEAKDAVLTDDDLFTAGYNNGIEAGKVLAISLLNEQENASKRNPVIICPHCGKRVK